MSTITVLDSTGATQTVAKVVATGSDVDANSMPVAFSTEGKATLGAITESAPGTDTASSGLNGRLQRIAQRLTSLIALTPAIGTAADAASSPVAFTTEGKAQLGAVAETAPATDTASSGLNGRLQRIAQRLTTIIAQTPTLGTTTDAASSPVAFSTEGKAQLGSITETAPASDTASSGLNGRLQRIAQNLTTVNTSVNASNAQLPTALGDNTRAASLSVVSATAGVSCRTSLTRTADTNAYAANDVLGAATGSTAALTFTSMGPSGGSRLLITSIEMEVDASAIISGETSYLLYLYNVTPPSALGDNAAWDLPSGDRTAFLGYLNLGTPVDLGSTLYVQTMNVNKQVTLAGTSLFGYLVTVGAFTPTSARVQAITVNGITC